MIVGYGMVGHRLCDELRKHPELDETRIVVFGDEGRAAYDRVHLAEVIAGAPEAQLSLSGAESDLHSRIEVVTGDPVVAIHRRDRVVVSAAGRRESYDHLVLCMGAAPALGNLASPGQERVRPLRTLDDALAIRELAISAKQRGQAVVVVGGGLLGLELASELIELGCRVDVLEGAQYPLARQLEESAGEALREAIARPGLRLFVSCRVAGVREEGQTLHVELTDGRVFEAGLVVPAMGIRARDQLAKEAGLPCDLFGGVEVNDALLTRDRAISAIGECARHRGVVYGLVAPGYAMAEQVARRLAGKPAKFRGVHVGTRLKVEGLELSVIGESSATGLGIKSVVSRDGESYRRLAVRRGKIIGITAIGAWPELPRAQDALARSETFRPVHLRRFERSERVWSDQSVSLHAWPDDATVCTCMGVPCGTLKSLAKQGVCSVEELSARSGAGTVCGSCKPLLQTLTSGPPAKPVDPRLLNALSLASIVGVLIFFFSPPVEISRSVQFSGLSSLWTDKFIRQSTGFLLLFLVATSVAFSARKRIRRFSVGDFDTWRLVHAGLGLVCLGAAFAHTGFRQGEGLDHVLLLVVLGSIFLGGVAGGYQLVLDLVPARQAQALRAFLVRCHIYLLWPLPVLLGFHVLKVYFF